MHCSFLPVRQDIKFSVIKTISRLFIMVEEFNVLVVQFFPLFYIHFLKKILNKIVSTIS